MLIYVSVCIAITYKMIQNNYCEQKYIFSLIATVMQSFLLSNCQLQYGFLKIAHINLYVTIKGNSKSVCM